MTEYVAGAGAVDRGLGTMSTVDKPEGSLGLKEGLECKQDE
jgi:hypothetical protein